MKADEPRGISPFQAAKIIRDSGQAREVMDHFCSKSTKSHESIKYLSLNLIGPEQARSRNPLALSRPRSLLDD